MTNRTDNMPAVLGGFKILDKIGSGAMGTVYKAHQISMKKTVALKVLSSKLARDEEYIERFKREMKNIGRLNHPNIVYAITAGEDAGFFYYAMEFVDGPSLASALDERGTFTEPEALKIAAAVAEALAHAWKNGIIHRDIKPANILLERATGLPKLADLGLAKAPREDASFTAVGMAVGTANYVAPEQIRGETDIDIRADIYSLGATLYRMVVGAVPFEAKTAMAAMAKALKEDFPDPRAKRPEISKPLATLIRKMTATDPAIRPQNPLELIEDIRRVESGRVPHPSGKHAAKAVIAEGEPEPEQSEQKAGVLPLYIIVPGAFVLLLAIFAAFYFLLGSGETEPPPAETQSVAPSAPSVPTRTPAPIAVKPVDKTGPGWAAYREAEAFEREHAGEFSDCIEKYAKVAGKFKDEPGVKAEERRKALAEEMDKNARVWRMDATSAVSGAIKAGKWADAKEKLAPWPEKLRLSIEKADYDKLAAATDGIIRYARKDAERRIERALSTADFAKAREALAPLAANGTDEMKKFAAEAANRIDEAERSHKDAMRRMADEKTRMEILARDFSACMERKDFAGACKAVAAVAPPFETPEFARLCLAMKEESSAVVAGVEFFTKHFNSQTAKMITLQTADGKPVTGKLLRFENEIIYLALEGMQGSEYGIRLRNVEPAQLSEIFWDADGKPRERCVAIACFFLDYIQNPAAAFGEMNNGRGRGARIPDEIEKKCREMYDAKARTLLAEACDAFARKKYGDAAERLETLLEEYAESEAVKKEGAEIRRMLGECGASDTPKADPKTGGLAAEYFTGPDFKKESFSRMDAGVNFNWSVKPPSDAFQKTGYSVRWKGKIAVPETGKWTIYIVSAGCASLYIDGKCVLKEAAEHDELFATITLTLSKGSHAIRLDYSENKGRAVIRLLWEGPNHGREIVPATCLMPEK
jgi:serine/threonine-protein kinase